MTVSVSVCKGASQILFMRLEQKLVEELGVSAGGGGPVAEVISGSAGRLEKPCREVNETRKVFGCSHYVSLHLV